MCGIAGLFDASGRITADARAALAQAMTDRLAHRGPDAQGMWHDAYAGIVLGHRRLSIVDLSPAGAQPMESASGRYVVSYNGEIYNWQALRADLDARGAAPVWRGHSDTEVLLAGIDADGLEATLARLNGMFALALWDRRARTLTLARDRMGEKPLYYGCGDGLFAFASELKALALLPGFCSSIDPDAVTAFLARGYVPAPLSIWSGVAKLPPAHMLVVDGDGSVGEPQRYWSPRADAPAGPEALFALLSDAVGLRMSADVPIGVFLSGGIDSSLVTALMQSQSAQPVRSFAIGFDDAAFDESAHAERIARHLGTEHLCLRATARDAQALASEQAGIFDEPFADSSQLPTLLLSRLTREHVTVALSGDGGDELFGGYDRYRAMQQLARLHTLPPSLLRSAIAGAAAMLPAPLLAAVAAPVLGTSAAARARRVERLRALLGARDRADGYARLTAVLGDAALLRMALLPHFGDAEDAAEQAMRADQATYLPDDLLVKVDRTSMSVGLEVRVPLLDHRLVEAARALPADAKIGGGQGKLPLRAALARLVPPALWDRPKAGFGVPLADWLRGPLSGWAQDLLGAHGGAIGSAVEARTATALWRDHARGHDRSAALWTLLMLQDWWLRHGRG